MEKAKEDGKQTRKTEEIHKIKMMLLSALKIGKAVFFFFKKLCMKNVEENNKRRMEYNRQFH